VVSPAPLPLSMRFHAAAYAQCTPVKRGIGMERGQGARIYRDTGDAPTFDGIFAGLGAPGT